MCLIHSANDPQDPYPTPCTLAMKVDWGPVFNICSHLSSPAVLTASPILINFISLSFCLMSGNSFPILAQTTRKVTILFSSVQSLSRVRPSVTSWLQHPRPPCPWPTLGAYSNSCPSSRWCHPAISSSVVPFSSRPQFLPASGSFPVSQLLAWGRQSIAASASVLPVNTQDWSPLG